jgi:hypothetical protein
VLGIPHLAIAVGQGRTVLHLSLHNVQLSPGTQFVLVPSPNAGTNVSADAKSANPSTVTKNPVPSITEPPPSIADERDLCVAPACTVALADNQLNQGIQGAQITVPLKGLGYVPPSANREMSGFDYDASIAYLGPNQLLFTFDPHTLVSRSSAEAISFRKLRIVRGVLIDLEKKEIVKTVGLARSGRTTHSYCRRRSNLN